MSKKHFFKNWTKIIQRFIGNPPTLGLMCKENSNSGRPNSSRAWCEIYWCYNTMAARGLQSPFFPYSSSTFPSPTCLLPFLCTRSEGRLKNREMSFTLLLLSLYFFIFSDNRSSKDTSYHPIQFKIFVFSRITLLVYPFFFFFFFNTAGLKVHTSISVLSKYIVYFFSFSAFSALFCSQCALNVPFNTHVHTFCLQLSSYSIPD